MKNWFTPRTLLVAAGVAILALLIWRFSNIVVYIIVASVISLIARPLVFDITQLTDNMVLQPFILGNSVYAHPIEIFLVIMAAGSLAGIMGMILAIPIYTVIRVLAKEFFNNFRVVQKLTEKI